MNHDILRKAAHFRNLSDESLERLAGGFGERRLDAGAPVFEAGDPVEALFVVARGTVLVFRGRRGEAAQPVARLCEGDLLGTADLFDQRRHTETAMALDHGVVLRGTREELLGFLADHPQVELNLRLAAARDLTARAKLALVVAQRRAVRHRVNRKVRIQPAGAGAVRVQLVDLSPFGMSMRGAPEGWRPEDVVEYRLEWGARRLDLRGRVAWREGDWLGIDLLEPPRELQEELEGMLQAMLSSPI